jgi:hypothetical protein
LGFEEVDPYNIEKLSFILAIYNGVQRPSLSEIDSSRGEFFHQYQTMDGEEELRDNSIVLMNSKYFFMPF